VEYGWKTVGVTMKGLTDNRPHKKLKEPEWEFPKRSRAKYKNGELVVKNAWLDSKAKLHICGYSCHEELAHELLDKGEYEKASDEEFCITAGELLERKGYIKLQTKPLEDAESIFHEPDHVNVGEEWFVTQKQYRFICDYMAHDGNRQIGTMNLRIK